MHKAHANIINLNKAKSKVLHVGGAAPSTAWAENGLRAAQGGSTWLQGDLTGAFQYLKWAYKKPGEGLFTRACSNKTRGNVSKV